MHTHTHTYNLLIFPLIDYALRHEKFVIPHDQHLKNFIDKYAYSYLLLCKSKLIYVVNDIHQQNY